MNARALALKLLTEMEERDGFANLVLSDRALAEAGENAGFLTALFYGTVERKITLDYLIGALSARSPEEISLHARLLLRLGLYQLLYMNVPSHAAVSETVSLGKDKGEKGFINAVLREADRRRDALPMPPADKKVRYLSVKYSFPQSTVRLFLSLFGEDAEKLFAFYNEPSPLCLTARSAQVRDELLARFEKDGVRAEKARYAPTGIRVYTPVSPTALYGFDEGLFFVQDEASAIAAAALSPEKGDSVIDVCAAPGGKTFAAAFSAEREGTFLAFDLYESKLSLIRDGAKRLGIHVSVCARDASVGDEALFETADCLICDVPCSGLGVLGKKADLRYREVNEALAPLQYKILTVSANYVKKGGRLLYSTCTLTKEENEENVLRFLAEHDDFYAEDFTVGDGEPLKSQNGMLTLLPHVHGTDGFFMARLVKKT